MRVEDLTKFEGECPNIVIFGTYMDIRVPLTKKWKKIINERGDKPNTYHNCLISYISEQIALSGFNMKSIGNLLIKGIVFNQNDYYKYNDVGGFPATINDLGYRDKNRVELNEDFHTVRLFNTVSVKSKNSTDEWYTPKEIIDALGEFDLDPCAPMRPLWRTARVMYNKEQDGLKQKWEGRVWLNPPYSRPTIEHFITRMVEHNNGIALLFNRLDNKMFQDVVFPKAKGILFMKGRIKFHREDGTIGESPGCGSILVAFGEENAEILRSSNIEGRYIQVNQEPCSTHVDWEQRRYEMAKTMLPITSVSGRGPHGELILEACDKAAELAVIYADALIKELK